MCSSLKLLLMISVHDALFGRACRVRFLRSNSFHHLRRKCRAGAAGMVSQMNAAISQWPVVRVLARRGERASSEPPRRRGDRIEPVCERLDVREPQLCRDSGASVGEAERCCQRVASPSPYALWIRPSHQCRAVEHNP